MAAVKRWLNLRPQYVDGNGAPANGYRLFFYTAGSSTKLTIYNSSAGTVPSSNPLTLNSLGEPGNEVWLIAGSSYKVGLAAPGADDPPAAFVWTEDNIGGINDTSTDSSTFSEWKLGPVPTYISATQFQVSGDQRPTFEVDRRVKAIVTGGISYGRVSSAVFAASVTTVTVDTSGSIALDNGLSAVYYALLSATNSSVPTLSDSQAIVRNATDPTKRVRIDASQLSGSVTRVINVPDYDIQLANFPHGSCQIQYISTTQIKLLPFNGGILNVAGLATLIPAAGISVANTGVFINGAPAQNLVASTVYDVYAFFNSGTLTLGFRTQAAHGPSATGVEVSSAAAGETLVGKVRANPSAQFVDSPGAVLNWFNRSARGASFPMHTSNVTTTSLTFVELNGSASRQGVLVWGPNSLLSVTVGGTSSNTGGIGTRMSLAIGKNGVVVTTSGASATWQTKGANLDDFISITVAGQSFALSEGFNQFSPFGSTGAGTASFVGGVSGDGIVHTQVVSLG
jgi:hypothetical protein